MNEADLSAQQAAQQSGQGPPGLPGLPELTAGFVGRDEQVHALEAKLRQCRLVTVVGAGGLGKTTLAVAVARRMAPTLADGVCLVDLARLSGGAGDTEQLALELALALGLESVLPCALDDVRQHLHGRRLLIVLDSCETVVDAAAQLVEDLLASAGELLLLATSREPLQANGEWVHRLAPLSSPPPDAAFPAWLALRYPAVQLFFRVAGERHVALVEDRDTIDRVAAICRELDGSPLAIRLAASHVVPLGLEGVAARVRDGMLTLPGTDDAGSPGRHRSLEAVLAWSYRLLQPAQQQALCGLAHFRGSFGLEAALAVSGAARRAEATALVLELVEKSLVLTQQVDATVVYRLADTTRAFAEAQPEAASRAARQSHALFLKQLLTEAEHAWLTMSRVDWRRAYGAWVEDVRHALNWAFCGDGERLLAIELTVKAFGLAEQTGLFVDFDGFALRAIDEASLLRPERPELSLRLHTLPVTRQARILNSDPTQIAMVARALEIGRAAGTAADQLGAMLGMFAHNFQHGDYLTALGWSDQMQQLADAHADRAVDLTARRTRAQALHFLGRHAEAGALARAICEQADRSIPLAYTPSPVSADVSMRIVLARIHWIEGRADRAWQMVDECLALAERDGPQSLCHTLALAAMPVALWCGRLGRCAAWRGQLAELSERYDAPWWQSWGRLYRVLLGPADEAAQRAAALEQQDGQLTKYRDHLGTFVAAELSADAAPRVESGTVGWCAPEVLRIRAERSMAAGAVDAAAADLARAIELSRTQGALAWELRAATSAARLSAQMGDAAGGRALLAQVYGRFTEGFSTRDLLAARALLAGL